MNGYTPDATVAINTSQGPTVAFLAKGGDQFPWTAHKGKVYVGLFSGTLEDGTSADDLDWNIDPYWVVEAFDQDGTLVELSPSEYREAVTRAGVRKTPVLEDGYCLAL
jgi:hypothetical protein